MAESKDIIPKKGKDGRTAKGLNASNLSTNIIKNLLEVNVDDYLEKDSNGNKFLSQAKAKQMANDSHQKLCDAINEEVLKNCYITGTYTGMLTVGSPPPPDLNGVYTFEVLQCNLKSQDTLFYATEHSSAIAGFQNNLALALTETILFKPNDTANYLTIPSLSILPGTLIINIPTNNSEANIDQQTMMDNLVNAVIAGIEGAQVVPISSAISTGPGKGDWTFTQII